VHLDKEARRGEHSNAAVSDLGLAEAVDLLLGLAIEQVERVEVADRRDVALLSGRGADAECRGSWRGAGAREARVFLRVRVRKCCGSSLGRLSAGAHRQAVAEVAGHRLRVARAHDAWRRHKGRNSEGECEHWTEDSERSC